MDESKTEVWLIGALNPIVIKGHLMKSSHFSELVKAKIFMAETTANEKIIFFVSNIAYFKEIKET